MVVNRAKRAEVMPAGRRIVRMVAMMVRRSRREVRMRYKQVVLSRRASSERKIMPAVVRRLTATRRRRARLGRGPKAERIRYRRDSVPGEILFREAEERDIVAIGHGNVLEAKAYMFGKVREA